METKIKTEDADTTFNSSELRNYGNEEKDEECDEFDEDEDDTTDLT